MEIPSYRKKQNYKKTNLVVNQHYFVQNLIFSLKANIDLGYCKMFIL